MHAQTDTIGMELRVFIMVQLALQFLQFVNMVVFGTDIHVSILTIIFMV